MLKVFIIINCILLIAVGCMPIYSFIVEEYFGMETHHLTENEAFKALGDFFVNLFISVIYFFMLSVPIFITAGASFSIIGRKQKLHCSLHSKYSRIDS